MSRTIKNDIKTFNDNLLEECVAMAEHAFSSGMKVDTQIVNDLNAIVEDLNPIVDLNIGGDSPPRTKRLSEIHNALSELVHPAKPRGLTYVKRQQTKGINLLGPIPAIRHMALMSLVALFGFIFLSVGGEINADDLKTAFLDRTEEKRLHVAIFLLSAAGVGASFASLYSAYEYVSKGVFDPNYTMTYWVRLFLGLTAGYILAELVFTPDYAGQIYDASPVFTKPLIALLGGFSANTVHRILNRFTEALGTLVESSTKTKIENVEASLQNQMTKKNMDQKVLLAREITQAKSKLQNEGLLSENVQKELDQLLHNLMNK